MLPRVTIRTLQSATLYHLPPIKVIDLFIFFTYLHDSECIEAIFFKLELTILIEFSYEDRETTLVGNFMEKRVVIDYCCKGNKDNF